MAGLGEDDPLGTRIREEILDAQEETTQLTGSSKEETSVQTAVGIRGGASASDFSRGHNQPAFDLGDSRTTVMPDEPTHWHPTPCVAKTSAKGENSVLVHGHFPPHAYSPAHACVTGAPVQDGRTRKKTPIPCSDWHHKRSSALVPGQYMALYKPLSQAGVTSARPVQDDTIHSSRVSQNNPAPQYPMMSNVPTANGTGHECVCTNTKKDRRSQDGKYIMKSVDDFKELQNMVHCCTQVSKIPWSVGKLSKLTDEDHSAFVNRFKQKQKPKIMWSSIKPTIPCTGVPFAKAKPPENPIWCPSFNCSACITVQLIWTFPNMIRQMRAAPLRRSESRAGMDGMCDHREPLNTEPVHADICSGKITPVAQYHLSLPTRQAHTCVQNRPANFAHPPNLLAPPQPKKPRSSVPNTNGKSMMDQPIYGTMQHKPRMPPGPGIAVNAAGAPGRVGMNPGVYHTAGAGQYSTNVPQQYPANHSSHPQISAPMYRSTDMYGRPMVPGSSPGNMPIAEAEGGATVGGEAGQSPPPREHWQSSVRQAIRDHLIKKILNGIHPVNDYNSAMTNPQYSKLVQFIQRVEDTFFRTCTSKDEYFAKMADKYQHLLKELHRTYPGPRGMNPMVPPARLPYLSNQWSPEPQPMAQQRPTLPMPSSSNPGSVPPTRSVDSGLGQPSVASRSSLDTMGPVPSVPTPTAVDSIPPLSVGPADLASPAPQQPVDAVVKQEVDATLTDSKPSVEMPRRPSITSPTANDVKTPVQPVVAGGVGGEGAVPGPGPLPLKSPTTQLPPHPAVKTPTNATPTVKVVPNPSLKKVFTKEELESALRPVFDAIWQQPDAWPFQEPVNPERLNIPDYFTIVKEPMDLATINMKLTNGMYNNPWEFCKDIWLMIDNAWLYNRKTSKVYKMCTKLFEVFNEVIDYAMKSLGYCCGMRYTYSPQVLYCYSKNLCPIPRDASYFGCDNRYLFCTKCFLEMPGETVSIGEGGYGVTVIEKCKFQELKNDHVEQEPMIDCIHCCRTFHKACVLWHESIWPEGYQCDACLTALGTSRKDNKFAAKKLPTTQLGMHLEKRVNHFLQSSGSGAGEITIRVVSSSSKIIETKLGMREKYAGEFPMEMPYRTKAMFVFEEIDGVDVCFFGMHVQEYSSDCPTPNTRRVYISYLDSVHFFQPKEYRTLVYHEIIIGYMEFVKKQGFSTAHIWACPPSKGDDYIFHCHPTEQKIPKPKRLVEWYRTMLERGKDQGVVHSYMDFYDYCQKENLTSPEQLPYFEGDFWPNVIEEQIKELDHELEEERKAEAEEADVHNSKKGASKRSSNKKANSKKASKSKQMKKVRDLSQRIFSIMDKHREVFFVVQLHDPNLVLTDITGDPGPLLSCNLMEGRDAFLTLAREKHWEFSSLRRAKYSTLAMLVTLHTQGGERFLYTCNMCQQPVETRYHCSECEDFDLCVCCYEKNGHEHSMTRLGMDLGIHDEGAGPKDPKEALNQAIQRFIQVLVHAAQCKDRLCKSPSCAKMKRIMHHVGRCKQCIVCKQFLNLCLQHAKKCESSNCPVPLCVNIKKHLQEKQRQTSIQESRFAARRMLAMRSVMPTSSSSSASTTPSTPARQQPGTPQQSPSVVKPPEREQIMNIRKLPSTPTPEDTCHNVSPSQEAGQTTLAEVDEL